MSLTKQFAAPLPHTNTPPTRNMTYDDDNRLATFNGQSVYSDMDGNLTTAPLTNSTFATYTYDARNRLLNVGGVTNSYDAMNNRVGITSGTNATIFVVNPNTKLPQVLMRIKNGVTNYYIYGPGLLYQVTETATVTNTLTYHYDYRGSTIALTDNNGNVTDRIEYSAYGLTTYRTGTNDTPFLFNGRFGVQTDNNGLLYMRARYYNPYLCRFLNPDPSGFAGGLNFYAFANGNPVSYLDPFGLNAHSTGDTFFSWVSGEYQGIATAAQNFSSGLYNAVSSPIDTAANIVGSILDQPYETSQALANGLGNTWRGMTSSDPNVNGQVIGNFMFFAASVGSGNAFGTGTANTGIAGVTSGEASALARQIYSIEVNGQRAVSSVEAFGSRAGSTWRGAATSASDLDIRITITAPEHFGAVVSEVDEIRALFQASKGIEIEPL